jgi:hypothetical protein
MIFKTEKDRQNAYHNTFSSNEGRLVLVDILGTLGFWDTITGEGLTEVEQNVLNLHAKKILERCGFWKPSNYMMIVSNMLGLIAPKKKKKRWWHQTVGEFTERKRK